MLLHVRHLYVCTAASGKSPNLYANAPNFGVVWAKTTASWGRPPQQYIVISIPLCPEPGRQEGPDCEAQQSTSRFLSLLRGFHHIQAFVFSMHFIYRGKILHLSRESGRGNIALYIYIVHSYAIQIYFVLAAMLYTLVQQYSRATQRHV